MAVFFTSDTHFGHGGALGLYRRPFASVAAMNEALVKQWNETVGPDDVVWHLGDFAIRQRPPVVADLLACLNGHKHLVAGNNDPPATRELEGWESVQSYLEIEADGIGLVLCHLPVSQLARHGQGLDQSARSLARQAEAAAVPVRRRRRCLELPSGHLERDSAQPPLTAEHC